MSRTERQQNRFILGVLIGGVAAFIVTNGNITSTIVVALIVGVALAMFWK